MIISIRFSNFYSFAQEALISFAVGKKPIPSGFDVNLPDLRLNKVIAVVGANGSGKTQFIKPLVFLSWFASSSFLKGDPDSDVPFQPHRLHLNEDTMVEVDFLLDGQTYRYRLVLNDDRIQFEGLYVKTSSQFSYLFKREKKAEKFSFKEKGFPFPVNKAETLRDNASLLSAAYSYDIVEARPFIDFFKGVASNVAYMGRRHFRSEALFHAAESYEKSPTLKARMIEVMGMFDLGLSNVEIKAFEATDKDGSTEQLYMPIGVHQSPDGKEFSLPFLEESSGTQSAFVMLERLLTVLEKGGCAVIDEIDNDLHPYLIPKIIEWFRFEHTNPHQAQLIFTCHTPEVLNRLQKHQIYLCEKQQQISDAWRLDEVVGVRADDNLYAKYMAGALGAVPEL
jgi:AAA15 family ATPase/GTPase